MDMLLQDRYEQLNQWHEPRGKPRPQIPQQAAGNSLGEIKGTTSCFDRIIISETIPVICFAEGMTAYLYSKNVRIFDCPKFAELYKEALQANAKVIAKANEIEIEFVRNSNASQEDIVSKTVVKNEKKQGLLYILSAMKACTTYKPWHD